MKLARARNKEACDTFICRHGLPDCRSIISTTNGVARQELRNQYSDPSPQEVVTLMGGLRARSLETYIVVSLAPRAPFEEPQLTISQPDDIDCQDRAMCERWLAVHAELHEKRPAASVTPLWRPKHGAWQPPPTYAFVGCSTKRSQELWRKCLDKIEADVVSEADQQSRDNMAACLEWVRLHGYPATNYLLIWAACGIATCTTLGEFSRFWAAHTLSPERRSVYAVGVVHGRDKVVCWRYGLAPANPGVPPLRGGHEETWPEYFVIDEWLNETRRYP